MSSDRRHMGAQASLSHDDDTRGRPLSVSPDCAQTGNGRSCSGRSLEAGRSCLNWRAKGYRGPAAPDPGSVGVEMSVETGPRRETARSIGDGMELNRARDPLWLDQREQQEQITAAVAAIVAKREVIEHAKGML